MFGNRYILSRAESNYLLKLLRDPDMKRNKRLDKAIAKRIVNKYKLIDWNNK